MGKAICLRHGQSDLFAAWAERSACRASQRCACVRARVANVLDGVSVAVCNHQGVSPSAGARGRRPGLKRRLRHVLSIRLPCNEKRDGRA
eukprot:5493029-Pleurochrysis_carterae.AAC.2